MKKILLRILVPLVAIALIVGLDQWTKYLAITYLSNGHSIVIIKNVLELVLVENEGMAWGMLQGMQWLFIIMTPIAIGAITFVYCRAPFEAEYNPLRFTLVMLVGGALGNFWDRCFRCETFGTGHVIDMIYVKAINFPVFNVADSFISVAFVLMIIMVIFLYKEEDFDRILGIKRKKKEQMNDEENN